MYFIAHKIYSEVTQINLPLVVVPELFRSECRVTDRDLGIESTVLFSVYHTLDPCVIFTEYLDTTVFRIFPASDMFGNVRTDSTVMTLVDKADRFMIR